MNEGKSIIDLQDKLERLPEFILLEQIRHFTSSIDIFTSNYKQLKNLVDFHNDPQKLGELFKVNNREVLYEFQQEIVRLLHNYVASALSLIDHSRRHYEKLYEDKEIFPEYQDEVKKRFIDVPVAIFTKELRQFMQHYKLPRIISKTNYTSVPRSFTRAIFISKSDLDGFKWSSKSKDYLKTVPDDIDIVKLIDSYYKIVVDFYSWFKEKQRLIHSKEIELVERKKREIADIAIPHLIEASLLFPNNDFKQFESCISSVLTIKEQQLFLSLQDSKQRGETFINILMRKYDLPLNLIDKIKLLYNE